MLRHAGIPPGAVSQFVGPKIYAVTKTKDGILFKEIKVPKGDR
jgi:hypothetical protein